MAGIKNVTIEFTLSEAKILQKAIQGYSPDKDNELISYFLYARITNKIEEAERGK